MSKGCKVWNIINSIFIACLYFWMLLTLGNFPKIEKQITEIQYKIQNIEFYITNTQNKK